MAENIRNWLHREYGDFTCDTCGSDVPGWLYVGSRGPYKDMPIFICENCANKLKAEVELRQMNPEKTGYPTENYSRWVYR